MGDYRQYIVSKRQYVRPSLSLGLTEDPIEDWQRQAKALRIRRQRILRQRIRSDSSTL